MKHFLRTNIGNICLGVIQKTFLIANIGNNFEDRYRKRFLMINIGNNILIYIYIYIYIHTLINIGLGRPAWDMIWACGPMVPGPGPGGAPPAPVKRLNLLYFA